MTRLAAVMVGFVAAIASLFGVHVPASNPAQGAAASLAQSAAVHRVVDMTNTFVPLQRPVAARDAIATVPGATPLSFASLASLTGALGASLQSQILVLQNHLSNTAVSRTPKLTFADLTAADIPDLSSTYLPLAGGTVSGNLNVTGSFSGGSLSLSAASSTNASSTNLFSANAVLTSATSTNLFSALGNFTNAAIGTLSTSIANIVGLTATNATTTNLAVTGTGYFAGNLGIGTTTPGSIFSVQGVANWTGATSTYYSTGGINLSGGCFAIAGNCVGLGSLGGTLSISSGGTGATSSPTARTNLGLGTLATQNGSSVAITGGDFSGGTLGSTTPLTSAISKHFSAPSQTTIFSTAAANAWLYGNSAISGNTTENNTFFSGYQINDNVVDTASQPLIDAFKVEDQLTSTSVKGGRIAIQGIMRISTTTANAGANAFYVSVEGDTTAAASDGGTSGTPMGSIDGGEFGINMFSAPNYANAFGEEVGVNVDAASSVQFKSAISVELGSLDATRGSGFDAALKFNLGGTGAVLSPGWANGIAFGDAGHRWPFASDSNLITAVPDTLNNSGIPLVAGTGLDFSKVLFSNNAIETPGFVVTPFGGLQISNLVISTTTSGISFDISKQIVTSISVSAAGSSCTVGDLLYFGSEGIATVLSVGGSGNVTSVSLQVPDVSSAPPSNPVSTTGGTCLVAPSLNLTWSINNSLSLNPSGGKVGIGTTSPTLALDVAGFVGSTLGYKQLGNTILYASSTIFSAFGGQGAETQVIATATSSDVTSGPFATAFGYQALGNATSSANQSTAFGFQALKSSVTASSLGSNTAFGYQALTVLSSGTNDAAVGNGALSRLTSGNSNTAAGTGVFSHVTSGNSNTGIGLNAGLQNVTGTNNVAIGVNALLGVVTNSYSNNTAVGENAGLGVTTGSGNSFLGLNSGSGITTGSNNVFLGLSAASTSATGSNNIALGYDIALPSTNGSNQLNIGNLIFGTGINGEGPNVSTGNIGIGTTTPSTKLQVAGDITPSTDNTSSVGNATYRWSAVFAANGTIQTSDARLKSNITDLGYGLPDLLKLRPVSFIWTAQPQQGTQLGFIAQEVQPVFPETVNVGDDANHTLGLTYTEFIPIIVRSIQDIAHITGTFKDDLIAWLGNASNGIQDLFAKNIYATNITTHQLTADELCAGTVCINQQQLAAILSATGQAGSAPGQGTVSVGSSASATSTPDKPPVIQINGDNPTTTGSQADLVAPTTTPPTDQSATVAPGQGGTATSTSTSTPTVIAPAPPAQATEQGSTATSTP
jgi:hypothetical protein